jgi:hypothetical protein
MDVVQSYGRANTNRRVAFFLLIIKRVNKKIRFPVIEIGMQKSIDTDKNHKKTR